MTIRTQLKQYARAKATRRLYRAVPWLGGIIALAAIGRTIHRKGWVGGSLDSALDFIPFVGGAKNMLEAGEAATSFPTAA